jgi:uncharacterized protein (TIGR02246 family)
LVLSILQIKQTELAGNACCSSKFIAIERSSASSCCCVPKLTKQLDKKSQNEALMNLQTTQNQLTSPADESAIRAFHHQMIDVWNRGSGEGFAAPFSKTADFIVFEGTHLKGRKAIAAFHQQAFDTVVKGTRLEGEVNFVRFVNSQLALMLVDIRVISCYAAKLNK